VVTETSPRPSPAERPPLLPHELDDLERVISDAFSLDGIDECSTCGLLDRECDGRGATVSHPGWCANPLRARHPEPGAAMKATFRAGALASLLDHAQKIVDGKQSIAVLKCVLLEAKRGGLVVVATNLDQSIRFTLECQVTDGAILLDLKTLLRTLRTLPDNEDTTLTVEKDDWVHITCKSTKFKLAGLPASDFPAVPTPEGEGMRIPSPYLLSLITATSAAITKEDARYYLAGALLVLAKDRLEMVGTDGHRMHVASRACEGLGADVKALVPRAAVDELASLLADVEDPITFHQGTHHLAFAGAGWTLMSKAIEGQFPAYQKIQESESKFDLVATREDALRLLRRVMVMAADGTRGITLAPRAGLLGAIGTNPNAGISEDEIPVEVPKGEIPADFRIALNGDYFRQALAAATTDKVTLGFATPEMPLTIRPVGGDVTFFGVVMPMRL
jgi:DNA polymerase-3 subunit beta